MFHKLHVVADILKIVWGLGLENGSERSKINTAKMASILIENVKKCTRIMEIIMFMITN